MPLLGHCLDSEQIRNEPNNGRLLKLLLRVTLDLPAESGVDAAVATAVEQDKANTKSLKKSPRGKKGKENTGSSLAAAAVPAVPSRSSIAARVFENVYAEKLMHQALRTPGQAQTLALRVLSSSSAKMTPGGDGGAAIAAEEDSVRQRRDLVLSLVEVGLAGADGSLVASAARALPALPCDLAAIVGTLVPTSPEVKTHQRFQYSSFCTGSIFVAF